MVRLAIVIGCLLVIVTTPSGADEPESRFPALVTLAPRKLDQGSIQGEAFVRIKPATVARGESFILECEIRCTSGAGDVWNGFLSEDVLLPAQIVIASPDGKVRHELLQRHHEPPAGRQPTRWILLRSTDSIGRELRVKVDARSEAVADLPPRDRIVDRRRASTPFKRSTTTG